MPKSRAEIQKAYRERKKQKEGESYLRKERRRRMTYYINAKYLTNKEKDERNEKSRLRVQKCRRLKKKTTERQVNDESFNDEGNTSGYDSISTNESNSGLVVRMNFNRNKRSNGPRQRNAKALSKACREIQTPKMKNANLEKKYKTATRNVNRLRKQVKARGNK
jgi:hypothetical protein